MYINPEIDSSYRVNNIGKTLYNTVLTLQPTKIIEFGCLYGYSTVSMALALKELGHGKIKCYDLWEDYQYKHSTIQQTIENIKKYELEEYVEFIQMAYYQWLSNPEEFDLMHLDISNTGDTILKTYESLPKDAVVLFEGGSEERDNIEWMKKYNATPINSIKSKVNYHLLDSNFPSLSIFKK